jgi:hypothetical protein
MLTFERKTRLENDFPVAGGIWASIDGFKDVL